MVIGDGLNIDALSFPIDKAHKVTLDRYQGDSGHYSIKLDGLKASGKPVPGFDNLKVIVDTGLVDISTSTSAPDVLTKELRYSSYLNMWVARLARTRNVQTLD